jgi:iron complex outermembrane receptor protein
MVSAIQTGQPDSTRYLPMIPPPKIQTSLRLNIRKVGNYLSNAYFKLEIEHHLQQDHYYKAYGTETRTPSYTLINAGLGGDINRQGKKMCSLYLNVNNLTDKAYQTHLSRLKYGPVNYRTGRTGVYNMGRNFSFKLVVPIDFK